MPVVKKMGDKRRVAQAQELIPCTYGVVDVLRLASLCIRPSYVDIFQGVDSCVLGGSLNSAQETPGFIRERNAPVLSWLGWGQFPAPCVTSAFAGNVHLANVLRGCHVRHTVPASQDF